MTYRIFSTIIIKLLLFALNWWEMMRKVSKFWIFHRFEIAENWNFEKTEYCSLAMIDIKPPKLGETKNETGLDSVLENNSALTRAYGVRGGPFFAPEKCLKEFILTWVTCFENPILLHSIFSSKLMITCPNQNFAPLFNSSNFQFWSNFDSK